MKRIVALPFKSQAKLFTEEARKLLEAEGFEIVANTTGKPIATEALKDMIRDAYAVVAGVEPYDRDVLDAARALKVIVRFGVGVDNFDLNAMKERNIRAGVITNYNAVAEYTLSLILSLIKNVPAYDAGVHAGNWPRYRMRELGGMTVGLLGFGRIGRRLAELLSGFGVKILAYDPYMDASEAAKRNVEPASMEEVLAQADVISLHLPHTDETAGLICDKTIALMKQGAYIINTSRGQIVDEGALYRALSSGRLSGAALDVHCSEPIQPDDPLLQLPNVIHSPHCAALSEETNINGSMICARSILSVMNGGDVEYPVIRYN